MKRPFLVLISIFFVLFIVISVFKKNSKSTNVEQDKSELTSKQKENIQQFWEIFRRATQHRIAGRLAQALQDYSEALKLNDRHEDSWYYSGGIQRSFGNLKEAEHAWKQIISINPSSSRAFLQLGNLYIDFPESELFNIDLATERFQRAHELNQEETGSILRLGQVELIRGDLKSAQNYFSNVTRSNFKSVPGYFLNGYISWKKRDTATALHQFKNALQYSKTIKSVTGVMGEGDTKTGAVLGQSNLRNDQSIFYVYYNDLSSFADQNPEKVMIKKYRELDAFLRDLRGKLKNSSSIKTKK